MTDTSSPKDNAWRLIMGQVELLQNHMRDLGIQYVTDHFSTDDGIAGLQGGKFINGCMSAVDLFDYDMPYEIDMITLTGRGDDQELEVHTLHSSRDVPTAAEGIFSNIIEFVYATGAEDAVIDGFDLKIETDGGVIVDIISETTKTWDQPEITETAAQLTAWFERKVNSLVEDATDRFSAISKRLVEESAAKHADLELEMICSNGSVFFTALLEGEDDIKLWNMRYEEMEERWPDLCVELEEIENLFIALESNASVGGSDIVRTKLPEPEITEGLEP
jgi:hypothetical protein